MSNKTKREKLSLESLDARVRVLETHNGWPSPGDEVPEPEPPDNPEPGDRETLGDRENEK